VTYSEDLSIKKSDESKHAHSQKESGHHIVVTLVFITKNATSCVLTIVFGDKISDEKVPQILVRFLRVTDILELCRSVLPCVLKQDLPAAWMLEVSHIIDFVIDEQPQIFLRVVIENLVQIFELSGLLVLDSLFGFGFCHSLSVLYNNFAANN